MLKKRFFRRQAGFTLIETLVALGIMAVIGAAFMNSMSTAYKSAGTLDEQTQAEALARSQLEQIMSLPYQDSGNYSVTVSLPPQYSMNITVTAPQKIGTADNYTSLIQLWGNITTIQEITVSVFRPTTANKSRLVFSAGTYKTKIE